MELWGEHSNQVVLDYGCGPGNDVTGFLVHSDAKQVIGADVSRKALDLAARRLALHQIDLHRVNLHVFSTNAAAIHLYEKVGFVHEGVLRQAAHIDGRYVDVVVMGILREEYD